MSLSSFSINHRCVDVLGHLSVAGSLQVAGLLDEVLIDNVQGLLVFNSFCFCLGTMCMLDVATGTFSFRK